MGLLKWAGGVLVAAMFTAGQSAVAQALKRDQAAEMAAAVQAAKAVAKEGPADIAFKDQATVKLPAGYVFIPQPEADQMMKAMGNGADPTRLGLIFPPGDEGGFIVARYIHSGYVKDDEARDWKSDQMLEEMKAGTEEGNRERAELGIPAIEVVGWVQPPQYDDKTHRLAWSAESKQKNAPADSPHGINYNTFVLGREGYISLNLVTDTRAIEREKPIATALLSATNFNSGKSYADFNASTDKVAEYGIAALVAGAAAKKLGFFAMLAVFVAKFGKVIALAAVGIFAVLGKFFKGRKQAAPSGNSDNSA